METVNFLGWDADRVDSNGNNVRIKVRLSDPCKNGHNDFSITGTIWEKGKPKIDKYFLRSGAIGDYIAEQWPELAIFERLHLCDYNGAPMYAAGNGFYHLKTEDNRNRMTPEKFQSYYRMTPEQFVMVNTAEDEDHFKYLLFACGVVEDWKREAAEAIALLEQMTGKKFVDNSTRSNLEPLTDEEQQEMETRIASGYYTPEALAQRAAEKAAAQAAKQRQDVEDAYNKVVSKAAAQRTVKLAILDAGLSLKNFIYYDHTNEGRFNWLDYEQQISPEDFERFLATVDYSKLPAGIEFKIGARK